MTEWSHESKDHGSTTMIEWNHKPKNQGSTTGLSTPIASEIEKNTQFQKYHNKRTGHGFAAEDANALNDFLQLQRVEKVGSTNEPNGPDRIVNGVKIQTKYYQTAKQSINAAFDKNGYRYPGQVIEVPRDQYKEAVDEMAERIANGEVTGEKITDSEEAMKKAKELVQSGSITYEQAKNIAKAGNIDSIFFDIKNNCITSGCAVGLSFGINYAFCVWNGDSHEEALKKSIIAGLQSGSSALIIGVFASQILRSTAAASGTVIMRSGVKVVAKTQLGKNAINAIAKMSLGKSVYGAAAVNHVSKVLRSNIITASVATVITTAPDFYRVALANSISWGQFAKNLGVNVACAAGGVGGWLAGTAACAAAGSVVPVIGTAAGALVGGILGALGGGILASKTAKAVGDLICEDDAVQMLRLVQEEAEKAAFNYLLDENEIKCYSDEIKKMVNASWLRDMYASGNYEFAQRKFANNKLSSICEIIISSRMRITIPAEDDIIECCAILVKETVESELKTPSEESADRFPWFKRPDGSLPDNGGSVGRFPWYKLTDRKVGQA